MGNPINKTELYRLRYPAGTKVMLTAPISDKYTPKEIGDIMTVDYVDDAGQIHGSWLSGGSMAIIIGVDEFRVIE